MASWAAIAKTEPVKARAAPVVPDKKPRTAVIDANAIINGGLLNLMRSAERAVTVPEVLREVRDKQSRAWLAALPFTIETQEPSEEAVRAVVKFARATGDMHALSAVDTRLLALARTLEASYYGDAHLRELPAAPKVQKKGAVDAKSLPGWGAQGGDWAEMDRLEAEELAAAEALLLGGGSAAIAAAAAADAAAEAGAASSIAAGVHELSLQDDDASGAGAAAPAAAGAGAQPAQEDAEADGAHEMGSSDEEEGGGDVWEVAAKTRNKARRAKRRQLRFEERSAANATQTATAPPPPPLTPAALAAAAAAARDALAAMSLRPHHLEGSARQIAEGAMEEEGAAADGSGSAGQDDEDEAGWGSDDEEGSDDEDGGGGGGGAEAAHDPLGFESAVCSVTADFAMQNVLLQMGLRLAAPDGRRVNCVSRWVLRCTACVVVTKVRGRAARGRGGGSFVRSAAAAVCLFFQTCLGRIMSANALRFAMGTMAVLRPGGF
jgi:RNA-binding protein NOB1